MDFHSSRDESIVRFGDGFAKCDIMSCMAKWEYFIGIPKAGLWSCLGAIVISKIVARYDKTSAR